MGQVAGRLADFTVITAEDPRTENLSYIMRQIAEGWSRRAREKARATCPSPIGQWPLPLP